MHTDRATAAELEADAAIYAPLCPLPSCHEPMTRYPHELGLGPELIYDEPAWLCLNVAAHGGKPNTAALWLTCEIEYGPMTEAEALALELVIPWEVD